MSKFLSIETLFTLVATLIASSALLSAATSVVA